MKKSNIYKNTKYKSDFYLFDNSFCTTGWRRRTGEKIKIDKNAVEKTALTNQKFKLFNDFSKKKLETIVFNEFIHNFHVKKWFVGGTGKKPYDCKKWFASKFCSKCGQIYLEVGSCNNPKCPACYNRWRYERAKSSVKRIDSFKIEKKLRVMHCVVSVSSSESSDLVSVDSIDKLLSSKIYPFLKTKNIIGGWVVFHPFRVIDSKKKELYEHFKDYNLKDSLGEFGLWKLISKLVNWRDFVYWSPHFHILGCSSFAKPSKIGEPFVFKRIADLKDIDSILRCSMYLLSHAGLSSVAGYHSIRWFGELSNCKWSFTHASLKTQFYVNFKLKNVINDFAEKEGSEVETFNKCAVCGGELMPMKDLHNYLACFSISHQRRLKYAYAWAVGDIPPPDQSTILELINFNELNPSRFEKPLKLNADKRRFAVPITKRHRLIGMQKKYEHLVIKYGGLRNGT